MLKENSENSPFYIQVKEEIDKLSMVIQVTSSGFDGPNCAGIKINNALVEVQKNQSNHHRGLHLVIINPSNFRIEYAKVFDTYKDSTSFDVFCTRGV